MKNTHDPFGDELKNRLANYSEEPDDKLWSGIASKIETVKPPVMWTKWLSIGSLVVVMTGALLYFALNDSFNEEIADAASASLTETSKKESDETISPQPSNQSQQGQQQPSSVDVQTQPATVAAAEKRNVKGQAGIDEASSSDEQNATLITGAGKRNTPVASRNNLEKRRARTLPSAEANSSAENVEVQSERNESTVGSNQLVAQSAPQIRVVDVQVDEQVKNRRKETESASELASNTQVATNAMVRDAKVEQTTKDTEVVKGNVDDHGVAQSADVVEEEEKQEDKKADEKDAVKQDVASNEDKKDDKPKSNRKLSLYLTAMPTFGYQRIEANQNDNVFIESISKVSNFSAKRLGIRAEVGAEYALSRKLRAFGGVLYYQRKQTIDYVERVPVNGVVETDVDTLVIIKPEFASTSRTFEYELRNIGIQVGVNYVLKEKKFLHTIGTGIEFHRALNKLPAEQQALGFSSNPSTFVFANLYYRLQYPAQGKLRAVFQPTFNYSLYLNQDMNAPFFVKPFGLGLNVGMTYHF